MGMIPPLTIVLDSLFSLRMVSLIKTNKKPNDSQRAIYRHTDEKLSGRKKCGSSKIEDASI